MQSWRIITSHTERREHNESPHSFALDSIAGRRVLLFERTAGKRRSSRRLFQESWSLNFEGFQASAGAPSNQEDGGLPATHFPRTKYPRREPDCIRGAIKIS